MAKRILSLLVVLAVFATIAPQVEAGHRHVRGCGHGGYGGGYPYYGFRPNGGYYGSCPSLNPASPCWVGRESYERSRYRRYGYGGYRSRRHYRSEGEFLLGTLVGAGASRLFDRNRNQEASYEPQTPYQEQEAREEERESEKLFRNDFANVTVQVYVGSSPRPFSLKPGERKVKEVPADAPVWAEVELKDAQGHKVLSQLQLGTGISSLPNEAGWVFHNPRQARRN